MSIIRYRSDEPIMKADRPWEEGPFIRPVSVIPEPDGSRLRLYYLLWHRPDFRQNLLCVAYNLYNGQSWTHDQSPRYKGQEMMAGTGIVELDPTAVDIP